MKKKELYSYREEEEEKEYTIEELKKLYNSFIDKKEYSDFSNWLDDMLKMQILIKTED